MKKGAKRKFMVFRYLAIIISVILVLSIILFVRVPTNNGDSSTKECQRDSDCIKMQTSCCPCGMGGEEACVPKAKAEEFEAKNCEENLMCIALYNCKIESCACRAGRCEAVPLQQE